MGAQLNIKDAKTVELARDLAKQLGKTVTETIRLALEREAAARVAEREETLRIVEEISAQFRAHLHPDMVGKTSKELMDAIYDDDGLPV